MIDILINWSADSWQAIRGNLGWMSWNLFLALIPLAFSFGLFSPPGISKPSKLRSPIWIWCIGLLIGLSFLPNAYQVGRQFYRLIQSLDTRYLLIAIAITLILMGVEIWQHQRQHQFQPLSLRWGLGVLVFILFLPNAPYVLTDIIHLIDQIRQGYSVWIISLVLIPQYILFMFIGFEAYVLSLIYLDRFLDRQGWKQNRWMAELTIHALCAIGIYLGRFQRFNSWDIITNPDVLIRSLVDNLINHRPLLVMSVTFVVLTVLYGLMKFITLAVLNPSSSGDPV
ncbi:DUF1361 domain-containing protein [Capilliphycus salinus ALCB114379]|uniref:DUF1361 domain-containing protein n=1 Tax=Capilliphycus salinus TaxID=2768948 RepID=UPI0039A6862D